MQEFSDALGKIKDPRIQNNKYKTKQQITDEYS